MSQPAPSDLFARPKARRREDWGQEDCHSQPGFGRSPVLLVLRGMVLGCPGSSSSLRGMKAVSTWDLPGSRARTTYLWAFPPDSGRENAWGPSPLAPRTPCPCSKALMAGWGPLLGPGQLRRREACAWSRAPAGAMGRWACGLQSMLPPWLPSSTRIHVRFLRSFRTPPPFLLAVAAWPPALEVH